MAISSFLNRNCGSGDNGEICWGSVQNIERKLSTKNTVLHKGRDKDFLEQLKSEREFIISRHNLQEMLEIVLQA